MWIHFLISLDFRLRFWNDFPFIIWSDLICCGDGSLVYVNKV